MKQWIPREKMSRKARKALDREKRETWSFSPVTRKVESKKVYNRHRKSFDRYDGGRGISFFMGQSPA